MYTYLYDRRVGIQRQISAVYVLPQSACHNCRKIADSTGKNGFFCPLRKQAIFPQQRCSLFSVFLTILMASESPAATMESVDGTTPSTVSSRRSAEARGRRLERERARRRQRLASETAAERERRLSQRRARDRARRAARSSPTSETRVKTILI